ncbi:MAG: hypothetical protein MR828_01590 [Clostridiales bacterium]|nr:hypothetical protein [Clostridiales bacterium]
MSTDFSTGTATTPPVFGSKLLVSHGIDQRDAGAALIQRPPCLFSLKNDEIIPIINSKLKREICFFLVEFQKFFFTFSVANCKI